MPRRRPVTCFLNQTCTCPHPASEDNRSGPSGQPKVAAYAAPAPPNPSAIRFLDRGDSPRRWARCTPAANLSVVFCRALSCSFPSSIPRKINGRGKCISHQSIIEPPLTIINSSYAARVRIQRTGLPTASIAGYSFARRPYAIAQDTGAAKLLCATGVLECAHHDVDDQVFTIPATAARIRDLPPKI